jgi:hypothetical protein
MSEPRNRSFWNSMPGYLTGIAAMMTAIVGVMRFIGERGEPARQTADAHPSANLQVAALVQHDASRSHSAVVSPVEAARAESPQAECGSVLGRWRWSVGPVGGAVDFVADGSAGWYAQATDPAPALIATWSCEDADSFVVRWPNGYVDQLSLANDGRTLSGRNQIGVIVTGTRP